MLATGADGGGLVLDAPKLRVFTLAELRAVTRGFKPEMVLGEGGFGRLYKGWADERSLDPAKSSAGVVVAFKKLNHESIQGLLEWQRPQSIHPSIVPRLFSSSLLAQLELIQSVQILTSIKSKIGGIWSEECLSKEQEYMNGLAISPWSMESTNGKAVLEEQQDRGWSCIE
ncbi:hypothetical protein QYE76_022123 [Lolium multiflorum]|uniref:Uncharacterized protein n=1 Tax=Lolium multiflorum TaxID=4521 RepID=A0AAD8R965_LOLMU|nr:hypothetical protein QYE76_022123 [Lolium multiflorum]